MDLHLLIGRLDGKLDLLLTHSADHEARLQALEAFKHRAYGLIVASSFAGGAAADHLISTFFNR
jgi:hypothetical protein